MDLKHFLLLLHFLTTLNEVQSELILINSTQTWAQARDRCRDEFHGHLVDLDGVTVDKTIAIRSCVNEDIYIWYNHYTTPTPWISMDGCIRFDCNNLPAMQTMVKASPFECLEVCKVDTGGVFAVQDRKCVCDADKIQRIGFQKNASYCDLPCQDDRGYCGGISGFTVYRLVPPVVRDSEGIECAYQKCNLHNSENNRKLYKVQLDGTQCISKDIYPMCRGNEKLDTETSWSGGIKECLTQHDEYMIGQDISEAKCHFTDNKYNIRYWATVFRSEYLRKDRGKVSKEDEMRSLHKVGTFMLKEHSVGLKLISNTDKRKFIAICEADAKEIKRAEMQDDSVVCDFHISTTPTPKLWVENIVPQEDDSHIEFIVIGAICAALIVIVIIIIVCILWRRRKRRDKHEIDHSLDSRQTVELIAKQFKELNSNNITNGGYRTTSGETHLKTIEC